MNRIDAKAQNYLVKSSYSAKAEYPEQVSRLRGNDVLRKTIFASLRLRDSKRITS